ncbi:MAG: hypothetical protein M3R15_22175 [Acidobacteriota bacterium]|nr:hypothetical protein [Acidobacteriota bacterium]
MNINVALPPSVIIKRLAQAASLAMFAAFVFNASDTSSSAQTGATPAQPHVKVEVSFATDIQPILNTNCTVCHNNADKLGGLSLESYDELMKGGAKGHGVVAGDSARSRLVLMVEGKAAPSMPPGGELKPAEIKAIKDWIDAGAHPASTSKMLAGEMSRVSANTAAPAVRRALPEIKPLNAVAAPVTSLAFRPDGKVFAATAHKAVRLFDSAQTPSPNMTPGLTGMNSAIRSLAFNRDGRLLAAGGGEPAQSGEIVIWDAASHKVLHTIKGHRDYVYAVTFSPDSKLLASSSYDRLIKIWDIANGVELKTLKDHIDAVYPVAFSPDGKWLASGSADRSVKFWDVASGRRVFTLSDSTDVVYTLAFHPSGKRITAAGGDRVIRTWDLTDSGGTLKESFIAHDDEIMHIAYSPDGSTLASTSADRTIKLWTVEGGRLLRTLDKQTDWSPSIAFSPDGKTLAVGSFDGSVRVYEVASGKLLSTPTAHAAR